MVKIALFSPLPPLVGGMSKLGESMYDYFLKEKFKVHKIQAGSGLQGVLPFPLFYLKIFLNIPKVDIFHVISASGNSLWLKDLPVMFLGKIFKKRTILHFVGGMAVDRFHTWKYYKLLPFILADYIVVPTQIMKMKLKQKIKDDKIIVIPNVVEIDTFNSAAADVKKSKFTLIAVKALEKYSGYKCLLDGFQKAKIKINELKIIIIGSGPEEKSIKRFVEKNKIKDVDFIKHINHEDLAKKFHECTIFVHGTKYESFGLAIVEAMASGLPIISSNVGGIPEIVKDNYNGFLFDYGDSNILSKKILSLLENRTLLNKFSKNSLKSSYEYSWDNIKKHWYQILT